MVEAKGPSAWRGVKRLKESGRHRLRFRKIKARILRASNRVQTSLTASRMATGRVTGRSACGSGAALLPVFAVVPTLELLIALIKSFSFSCCAPATRITRASSQGRSPGARSSTCRARCQEDFNKAISKSVGHVNMRKWSNSNFLETLSSWLQSASDFNYGCTLTSPVIIVLSEVAGREQAQNF